MKKLLSLLLIGLGLCTTAKAAVGDTTTIVSHSTTSILHFGDYDSAVVFPNGSTSYRKINMTFTLGKETCPPGTQYCAQWDYTVQVILMTATDTLELGRFITPYAHSSYPNMPLNWKHDYVFDVTDFYPLLKDGATIRLHYSGYSWGFTGAIKFDFVEGTRPRDVVDIKKVWRGSYKYGVTADPINTRTAAQTFTVPTGTVYAEAVHIISGHGGDAGSNCSEFCSKWYKFLIDGATQEQVQIWRNDCGVNWVYPQSGTWVYNRANWCPGDVVFPIVHKIPAATVTAGTFSTGMEFQDYTSSNQTGSTPSYSTSNTLFFYKEFNHMVDAGIEDIVAPNNKDLYFRMNPICNDVKVKVKNYGKNPLTTMTMQYGIVGQTPSTYTWTGSLASMENAIISLPALPEFMTLTGTNQFKVVITQANGAPDGEQQNDTAMSTFVAPPKWDKGNFVITMTSSSITQNGNASKWIVRDQVGNIVSQRTSVVAGQVNIDTMHLENGCYSLEVIAEAGYGFRFLTAFSAGSLYLQTLSNGAYISLPKYNPGNPGLAGDFGSGFIQEFVVTNSEPLPTAIREWNNNIKMSVSPNPANTIVNVNVEGLVDPSGTITINNMLGQTVLTRKASTNNSNINIQQLPSGVYNLIYNCSNGSKMEKLVISR